MKKMLSVLLLASLFVTACSKDDGGSTTPVKTGGPTPVVSEKPVTLKLFNYGALTDETFKLYFVDPVKKKYPHITLEMINLKDMPIANLAASGVEVDIITGWGSLLDQFGNFNLLADLNPLIKELNIDLSRFETTNLDGVKIQSDTIIPKSLLGLPFGYNYYATFYNKDIFDKFGVAYPKDGMTWEDAIELGRKLTRLDNNVQYKGLDPEGLEKIANSLSIPYIDRITEKAVMNTEQWKRAFELTKQINDIPGNDFVITGHGATVKRFLQGNVAMLAAPEVLQSMGEASFKWDVAQYPSFSDRRNISGVVQTFVVQLSTTSKHQKDAVKVMDLATSDDVQLALSKTAIMVSTLKNPNIQKDFGTGNPLLNGKSTQSMLKSQPAAYVVQTRFTGLRGILETEYKNYHAGKIDVNTALRQAQEKAQIYIDNEKKK
jgi:multiple sugar transport system substrate-binding protein